MATKTIQNAANQKATPSQAQEQAKQNLNVMINSMLDKEGLRKRFDELLGKRTPQFMSSLVSLLNATPDLQKVFYQSPMTVIQSALKAAIFDLPIDPNLGFAYIVPFKNEGVPEATFIMGYKGMQQLAWRTGMYERLNVIDIREGELKSFNRLTEEIEIDFIEDDDEREQVEIVGYVGYFKFKNGAEKTIYMSLKQIKAHELKHRKGKYMGKGWRDDFEAMCAKTVMRRLIGKWGLMSIDYQQTDRRTLAAAEAIAKGSFDDEDELPNKAETQIPPNSEGIVDAEYYNIDPETGEILEQKQEDVSTQAQNEESLIEKHKRMTARLDKKIEEDS